MKITTAKYLKYQIATHDVKLESTYIRFNVFYERRPLALTYRGTGERIHFNNEVIMQKECRVIVITETCTGYIRAKT